MAIKSISRLHFISLDMPQKEHAEQAYEVFAGGGNWVQLRVKDKVNVDVLEEAKNCSAVCMDQEATLIINDDVNLAVEVDADGVHLGKCDVSPSEARTILGEDKIIGGTANTFEDIKRLIQEGVDYIGLGPFKFTETKKNLSPVLGIEGYQSIVEQCRAENISIPIIAIGGIEPNDIKDVMSTGIYGIAISSYLARHENPAEATLGLLEELGKWSSHYWTKSIAK